MTTGAKKEASVVEGSTDISKAVAALKSRYCQWLDGQQWDRWPSFSTRMRHCKWGRTRLLRFTDVGPFANC